MTDRPCDRCGGPTKKKEIISKREATKGRKFTVRECLSGCLDGDFPHTFFPPRDDEAPAASDCLSGGTGGLETADCLAVLKRIEAVLKDMRRILANPGKIHVFEDELRPDEEVPFQ